MPVFISMSKRIVTDVSIEIQRLWIIETGVGNRFGRTTPVGAGEPPLSRGKVPGSEVIEARLPPLWPPNSNREERC